MEISIKKALEKGVEAHKAGRVQEADRFYTAILKTKPNHPDANHNMGVLAVSIGKLNDALPFFRKALDANPAIAQFWFSYIDTLCKLKRTQDAKAVLKKAKENILKVEVFTELEQRLSNTGNSSDEMNAKSSFAAPRKSISREKSKNKTKRAIELYQQGKFQEAIYAANSLLKQNPKSAILYNIIGAARKEKGELEEAIAAYRTAVAIRPTYSEAYTNMGNALKEKGELEDAITAYKTAISYKPHLPEAHNNMGLILKNQGKIEEAIAAYKTAISIRTDYVDAYNNLGIALEGEGKIEEAIAAYKTAISIRADYVHAYNNLGTVLHNLGRLDEAIASYKTAISIKSDFSTAYNNLGITLEEQGKPKEAEEAYNNAIVFNPNFAEAYNNLGSALKNQNRIHEALAAYQQAITIRPNYAEAYRNLSTINKYKFNNLDHKKVLDLYNGKALSDEEKCHYGFTLAKIYEDNGMLDQAFKFLSLGNDLRKKSLKYSIRQDKKFFKSLKITQRLLQANSLKTQEIEDSILPIFILGMPRSGTTIVEQIVSAHSQVTGAGELTYVSKYGYPLAIGDVEPNQKNISDFRSNYLMEINTRKESNTIVTDKMPHNFCFIPLICAALPEAKIVHVTRDAAATCWSNFRSYFINSGLGYSYSIKDLTAYYGLYRDLMETWNREYEDRIYNINYDRLVEKPQLETKKLVKYLEIKWENACLHPERNRRNVRTISQHQVSKKIYKGSSLTWQRYRPYLDGLFDSL